MPIQVRWDDEEKTVLRYIYEGEWAWREWHEVIDQSKQMIHQVDHPVYVVLDTANGKMPPGTLSYFNQVSSECNDCVVMVILIGADWFIQRLFNIYSKLRWGKNRRFTVAVTLENANQIVQQHKQSHALSKPA